MMAWDVYEITSPGSPLHGVFLRSILQTYADENNFELLAENVPENSVRVAIPTEHDISGLRAYVTEIIPDTSITLIEKNTRDSVLGF